MRLEQLRLLCAIVDHGFIGDRLTTGSALAKLPCYIAELETARYGINLVVVVNNNAALNQEIPLVIGGMRQPPRKTEELWDFEKLDFAKVAASFGCVGLRAENPAELKVALGKAFTMGRPVVIDAVTDKGAFAKRAWLPEGASSGH